jgi:hypothetical protein
MKNIPSYHEKFQFSSAGSSILKNLVAATGFWFFLVMVNLKSGSGSPTRASDPLTGECTSKRMSKYWPARKSALQSSYQLDTGLSDRNFLSTHDTYWSGGNTHPRSGQPPSRWKVWARVEETRHAITEIDGRILIVQSNLVQAVCKTFEGEIHCLNRKMSFPGSLKRTKVPRCSIVQVK